MTDLAPDGRARLAGKRGTDIGKVRGEGAIFCGKRSGARLVRRASSRSIAAKADRERKAQDSFSEKERRVGRECPHAGGEFCGKKRGLISDGAGPRAKLKAVICSGGDRGRGARKSLRKEQSRLSGGVFTKNKTPTNRGFGSASGGPHPHYFKGS